MESVFKNMGIEPEEIPIINPKELKYLFRSRRPCLLKHYSQLPKHGSNRNEYQVVQKGKVVNIYHEN